ncbi:response regulator [Egicoccus halophilus]|uniref:response regulator n=1 Tax=Egicoccus halophilus TaxID=1670830 RepID=UPI0013EEB1B2|nr:response regulator [Egicoccus halophilus]
MHASSELPRLVVVDDDRTIRDVVSLTLRSSGQIEVVGLAADGAEAMQMVADEQPDVVLLDLMLGAERGTDLIAPLLRSAPRSMIAMMTSVPAELEELNSLRAGAFVYYEKTMLSALARFIADDLSLFRRALGGEDVVAPSSLRRRSEPTGT